MSTKEVLIFGLAHHECMLVLNDRALVARALIENPNLINWWLTIKALVGLLALICGNGYIVGINQIYDIGIDKYVVIMHCTLLTDSSIMFFFSISNSLFANVFILLGNHTLFLSSFLLKCYLFLTNSG